MATLYDRIKSRRTELGLTVEELAHKMGYKDKSSISKIENGKADIPQSKIAAFADALQTTPAYLMGWEEQPEPKKPTIPPGFEPMPKMDWVPLVGRIACGTPILADENIEAILEVPEHIRADFALRCHGDSMTGAHIHDGDIVYIRQQPDVDNGSIAAVCIDNSATLKRVYKYPDRLVLSPDNPMYEPFVYTGDELAQVRILGKAVGFTSLLD